jgi:hypothetical protein
MFNFFKKKPSYDRDYIIGSLCSMIEAQMDESDLESFLTGKLVISNEVRSIGWIGGSSAPRDGYSLLLNLNHIENDEKTLLTLMLEGVAEAQGMAKTVATDMVAVALHKCLKKGSAQYAGLTYQDPRLR